MPFYGIRLSYYPIAPGSYRQKLQHNVDNVVIYRNEKRRLITSFEISMILEASMKMKRLKTLFAYILAVCMLIVSFPVTTQAADVLYWPVPGHTNITQYFHSDHDGIDISDGSIGGATVIAAMGGTVHKLWRCGETHLNAGDCNGFGTGMVIYGDDGRYYQYAHMQAGSIPAEYGIGTYIPQGGIVGRVGTTGWSTGNHLHFQICTTNWWTGAVDPFSFNYTYVDPSITYENLGDDFYAYIKYPATPYVLCNVNNNVQLGDYGSAESVWRFVRTGTGSYKIFSLANGWVMDVFGNGTEIFTNICCYEDTNTVNQLFYIQRANAGYNIVAANSMKVLDVYNGVNSGWGENVQLYTSLGTVDQLFDIEILEYSVSFDANGGTGAPATQTKVPTQPLTLSSETPTREGWIFTGWAEAPDATQASYLPGASFTKDGTTTLYAVWKRNATPSGIIVNTNPDKVEYEVGEELDITGLTLALKYSDGSEEILSSGFTVNGFSSDTVGEKTVTVSYGGFTTTFTVTVRASQTQVDKDAPQIFLQSKQVNKGQEFTVTAEIRNHRPFSYLEVTPILPAELTLVQVENGDLISDMTKGKQYIWVSDTDIDRDGLLMTFTFQAAEDVQIGTYSVGFVVRNCINAGEESVDLAVVNATIEVTEFTYGDATGDGKIDGFDVIRLKKYLANYDYDTETSTVEICAGGDATGDGKVDGFDVIRLKKYLANYDYETGNSTVVLGPQ
ncbi:MAG: hypothetical protein E7437_08715 [Ruminococcaceae bacterium]|nr:hypothetical protein [Oscillospiraceae bacterium]